MMWMDILDGGPGPKRGDLIYTALKDRRGMRMRIVLRSRLMKRRDSSKPPRYQLWMERWWEIEPEVRMRLWRSACRRPGGQRVFFLDWYPRKKKAKNFESMMRRSTGL